jgi:hypothetical protein
MTSKTKSGALDKHCGLCNNKKLTGNSLSKHVKSHVGKGLEKKDIILTICSGMDCPLCKSTL